MASAGFRMLPELAPEERRKAWLLSAWFFVTVTTLWLLEPIRVASLLAHLGAAETRYVQLASVATIAVVVMLYTRIVSGMTRIGIVRWSNAICAMVFVLFWGATRIGGPSFTAQRTFVWSAYILVEIYAAVMIGIFWTYTNDVVTPAQADRMYAIIGLGGIVGGIAGGVFVDLFARRVGPSNLLLVCAALVLCSAALASLCDALFRPAERVETARSGGLASAFEGAREVRSSPYLSLVMCIVVANEVTATFTNFGINYSLHEATAESLYVPLTERQKYEAKAFIDMFVDRAAKAAAALMLLAIIRYAGATVRLPLVASFASIGLWLSSAERLGSRWFGRAGDPQNAAGVLGDADADRERGVRTSGVS